MSTLSAPISPALWAAFGLLLLAALAAPLLARRRRAAGIVHLVLTAAAAAVFLVLGAGAVFGRGMAEARTVSLGPVAVPILLDGLAGLFLVIVSFLAAMSAIYAVRYADRFPAERGLGGFYAALPLFVLGMAGLVVVNDFSAGFTIAWQVMAVASFFLIRFEKNAASVRAAGKYLVLMEAAWLLVIAGGLAAGGGVGESLQALGQKVQAMDGAGFVLVLTLFVLGFGFLAGVFPLGRIWLPDAQAAAPAPANALLSGAMLKIGVFGLFRVFFCLAPAAAAFNPRFWGPALAAVGVLTLFVGTLQSVKQSDAKRLLAFSSIGQVGYIVLALGVSLWTATASDPALRALAAVALLGALFHAVNHAAVKGLLFLISGNLHYAAGTKDLNKLGGLITLMPVSAVIAAVASLSISGMPPTSGFASKETIISAALLSGAVSPVLVLFGIIALFTSAVTLACYVKFFGLAFTASGAEETARKQIREVPLPMLLPEIILGILVILQGLAPSLFLGGVSSAAGRAAGLASVPGIGEAAAGHFNALTPLLILGLLVVAILAAALLRRSAGSKTRAVPTWLCGYQQLDGKNRYIDRGMFAALKQFFRWTGGGES